MICAASGRLLQHAAPRAGCALGGGLTCASVQYRHLRYADWQRRMHQGRSSISTAQGAHEHTVEDGAQDASEDIGADFEPLDLEHLHHASLSEREHRWLSYEGRSPAVKELLKGHESKWQRNIWLKLLATPLRRCSVTRTVLPSGLMLKLKFEPLKGDSDASDPDTGQKSKAKTPQAQEDRAHAGHKKRPRLQLRPTTSIAKGPEAKGKSVWVFLHRTVLEAASLRGVHKRVSLPGTIPSIAPYPQIIELTHGALQRDVLQCAGFSAEDAAALVERGDALSGRARRARALLKRIPPKLPDDERDPLKDSEALLAHADWLIKAVSRANALRPRTQTSDPPPISSESAASAATASDEAAAGQAGEPRRLMGTAIALWRLRLWRDAEAEVAAEAEVEASADDEAGAGQKAPPKTAPAVTEADAPPAAETAASGS